MRAKANQSIIKRYQLAGRPWPASAKTIAQWAMDNRMWEPHPAAALRQCARELSRAMREEYITDSKGRRVRVKHPVARKVGAEQTVLWDDIRTAPRSHMEVSFRQRRERIVGDCRQLKTDADSYNDAHFDDPQIEIIFDFTYDMLELEAADAA
jgi:hypothetical protein